MSTPPGGWPPPRTDAARLVVLVAPDSSLSPSDLCGAAGPVTELWFMLDASDPGSENMRELCRELGPVLLVDFADPGECVAAVRRIGAAAVTTFVEALCPLAVRLDREACGYLGNEAHWGRKDLQRAAMRAAGVSRVRSAMIGDAAALRAFADLVGYPFVLKPVDGFASRSTWRLGGDAEVEQFIRQTAAGGGWPGGLYAEEYIVGRPGALPWVADYGSVDVLLSGHRAGNGGLPPAAWIVAARTPLAWPFRETGMMVPSPLPQAEQDSYIDAARRALAAVGATRGTFHVEVKDTAEGPEIIEVNGRLGGFVARGVRLASGLDLARHALERALGREPEMTPDWHRCVAVVLHPSPPAARQVAVAPPRRELMRLPGVIAVDHIASAGSAVHWRNGTLGLVARCWVAGADHDELRERLVRVNAYLTDRFEYVDEHGSAVVDHSWLETLVGGQPIG